MKIFATIIAWLARRHAARHTYDTTTAKSGWAAMLGRNSGRIADERFGDSATPAVVDIFAADLPVSDLQAPVEFEKVRCQVCHITYLPTKTANVMPGVCTRCRRAAEELEGPKWGQPASVVRTTVDEVLRIDDKVTVHRRLGGGRGRR